MKAAELRRYKRFALSLLGIAALLFVSTHYLPQDALWVHLLQAGAEAGIVGGLADWFAVTALFRHPMGIPIPHTALIARNKTRIGASLGQFIERHFLEPEQVAERLGHAGLARRIGVWAAKRENAEIVSDYVFTAAPHLVRALEDRQIRDLMRDIAADQVRALPLSESAGGLIELITKQGHHRALLDRLLGSVARAIRANEDRIFEIVTEKSKWWVPERVDAAITNIIIKGVIQLLDDVAEPGHPVRGEYERALDELVERLKSDPAFAAKAEEWKLSAIEDPQVQELLGSLWDRLRDYLLAATENPDDDLRTMVREAIVTLGDRLANDPELAARLDRRIEDFALSVAVPLRSQIATFISDVVAGWDTETLTQRIELEIGKDLQFVRINGTLVGSLVGVIIFLISEYVLPAAPALLGLATR